nr:MAG TPA: hypothetical protein [Bacteriophage sp.]
MDLNPFEDRKVYFREDGWIRPSELQLKVRIIEDNSDELQGFYSNPKIVLPTLPWSARVKGKSSCIVLKQN